MDQRVIEAIGLLFDFRIVHVELLCLEIDTGEGSPQSILLKIFKIVTHFQYRGLENSLHC